MFAYMPIYIYIHSIYIYIYIDITGVSHFEKTPLVHRFNHLKTIRQASETAPRRRTFTRWTLPCGGILRARTEKAPSFSFNSSALAEARPRTSEKSKNHRFWVGSSPGEMGFSQENLRESDVISDPLLSTV